MNKQLADFKVTDRQSFIAFVDMLLEDLLNNPDSWENKSLSDFLEALSRYSADIQGYYDNTNQKINADHASWQTFADIFKGATIYE